MIKKSENFISVILLCFLVISSQGCIPLIVGAVAGVGGYAWVSGELKKEFQVSATQLQAATFKAFKSLDLATREVKKDRLSARISSKFADGKAVSISIDALTEKTSQLKVRVGVFGDKAKSEMILNAVEKYLY